METGVTGNKPQIAKQASAFTKAALRRAGIEAEDAGPETIAAARENFGAEYDSLVQRAGGLQLEMR